MTETILIAVLATALLATIFFLTRKSKTVDPSLLAEVATLQERIKHKEESISQFAQVQERLTDTFKALSAEALQSNNQSFMETAKTLFEQLQSTAQTNLEKKAIVFDESMKPLKETLKKVDERLQEVEKSRVEAYSGLIEQVKMLSTSHLRLQTETSNLVKALKTPNVRGRWGEFQLKRVVELAGMLEHCDFYQQESVNTESGRLRPDMIIRLPGEKRIVVDAKASIHAYLEAIETTDDVVRAQKMKDHARQVKDQLNKLASKSYWEQFDSAPDFVILFIPGEAFFSAALQEDPTLLEYGIQKKVIIASPTSLISLLQAASYGWNQEKMARNAQEISLLGKTLYDRILTLVSHIEGVKVGLEKGVDAYNKMAGALEARVLPAARRIKELGAFTGDNIAQLHDIESTPRPLHTEGLPVLRSIETPETLVKTE